MTKAFEVDTKVQWAWGDGCATGYVREVFHEKVSRVIKGTEVTREASKSKPAYVIEQQDGDKVLKSHSEISRCD